MQSSPFHDFCTCPQTLSILWLSNLRSGKLRVTGTPKQLSLKNIVAQIHGILVDCGLTFRFPKSVFFTIASGKVCHTGNILTTLDITSVNYPLQVLFFQCYVTSSMDNLQNYQSELHKVGIVAGFKGVNKVSACIKLSLFITCHFYMLCSDVTHAAPHSGATTDSLRSFSAAAELLRNCNSTVATAVVATWVAAVPWFIQTMQKIGLFTVSIISH